MGNQVSEGSLHKWFKGSKSKDGKGGWVNVVTGGTCASDEPGEGTPKCVSSAKRASMSKKERLSAARRKKKADPNQQQKSGAAKPTYVSTDKKKMKETYQRSLTPLSETAQKCWKGYEKKGTKKMFGKTYNNCVKKEEVEVYNESIPVYGPGPGQRKPKPTKPEGIPPIKYDPDAKPNKGGHIFGPGPGEKTAPDGPRRPLPKPPSTTTPPKLPRPTPSPKPTGQDLPEPLRKPIATLDRARKGDGYLGPTIRAGGKRFGIPNPFDRPKTNPSYGPGPGDPRRLPDDGPKRPLPKPDTSPRPRPLPAPMPEYKPDTGGKKPVPMPEYKPDTGGKKPVPMPEYKPSNPKNKKPEFRLLRQEETEIQESDKKGKGSGTKDACYHKVKSRYSVWPSAYASGALVKCRKKGAANWGNSTKKEQFSDWKSEFIWEDGDSSKKLEEKKKLGPGGDPFKKNPALVDKAIDKLEGLVPLRKIKKNLPTDVNEGALNTVMKVLRRADPYFNYNKQAYKFSKIFRQEMVPSKAIKKLGKKMGLKNINPVDDLKTPIDKGFTPGLDKVDRKAMLKNLPKDKISNKGYSGPYKKETTTATDAQIKRGRKEFRKKYKDGYSEMDPRVTNTYIDHYDWRNSIDVNEAAWQRKEGKSESGGLNAKGVASYRAENPGSKLKTAVTKKPSSLKRGSKDAKRRKSFCSRMRGMKKKLTSAKTARDPNSRINKSLRKWNC